MDPSYSPYTGSQFGATPGAGGFSGAQPGAGFGSGAGAGMQPGLGGGAGSSISSGTGDIVLSKTGGKSKKPLIIGLIVFVILAIAGAVAAVVVMNMNKSKLENAEELNKILGQISFSGQCPDVVNGVENSALSVDDYSKYVDGCRNKTAKVIRIMGEIGSLKDSSEYKQIYTELNSELNSILLVGEGLEADLAAYSAWHEWFIAVDNMLGIQTKSDIESIAFPLMASGIEWMESLGAGWVEKAQRLMNAKTMLNIVGGEGRQAEFERIQAEYDSYMTTMLTDFKEEVSLDNSKDLNRLCLIAHNFGVFLGVEG